MLPYRKLFRLDHLAHFPPLVLFTHSMKIPLSVWHVWKFPHGEALGHPIHINPFCRRPQLWPLTPLSTTWVYLSFMRTCWVWFLAESKMPLSIVLRFSPHYHHIFASHVPRHIIILCAFWLLHFCIVRPWIRWTKGGSGVEGSCGRLRQKQKMFKKINVEIIMVCCIFYGFVLYIYIYIYSTVWGCFGSFFHIWFCKRVKCIENLRFTGFGWLWFSGEFICYVCSWVTDGDFCTRYRFSGRGPAKVLSIYKVNKHYFSYMHVNKSF